MGPRRVAKQRLASGARRAFPVRPRITRRACTKPPSRLPFRSPTIDATPIDPMSTTWTLQVIEPDKKVREFPAKDGLVIGSHIDCGLVLMDKRADGHHAKIVAEGDEFAILDLGSEDGTKVDGEEVLGSGQKQTLRVGMELEFGMAKIIVMASAK
ncbi:MAG: pSer/pThr/pTyr-binding forkhead associated (FHA) protein [Planctomycetota bacterium]|jgi:pSer/pThr/pTyr-binding forkhead associated (FHA) protein